MAASRPEPGPLTQTSTSLRPKVMASLAAVSAASPAAKGVPFFEPLKPWVPADAHERQFPVLSVMVMMVLLNVERICAVPRSTNFFSFLRVAGPLALRGGKVPHRPSVWSLADY